MRVPGLRTVPGLSREADEAVLLPESDPLLLREVLELKYFPAEFRIVAPDIEILRSGEELCPLHGHVPAGIGPPIGKALLFLVLGPSVRGLDLGEIEAETRPFRNEQPHLFDVDAEIRAFRACQFDDGPALLPVGHGRGDGMAFPVAFINQADFQVPSSDGGESHLGTLSMALDNRRPGLR